MSNLCYVLGGLESTNKNKKSDDKLLQIILGFGHGMQMWPLNSRHGTVTSSYSRHQRAEIRCLHDQLDSPDTANHQLLHKRCSAQDTLESEEVEFGILAADYYRFTNGCRRRASNTRDEREPKRRRAPDLCRTILFHLCQYEEDEDHGLQSKFCSCRFSLCRY